MWWCQLGSGGGTIVIIALRSRRPLSHVCSLSWVEDVSPWFLPTFFVLFFVCFFNTITTKTTNHPSRRRLSRALSAGFSTSPPGFCTRFLLLLLFYLFFYLFLFFSTPLPRKQPIIRPFTPSTLPCSLSWVEDVSP